MISSETKTLSLFPSEDPGKFTLNLRGNASDLPTKEPPYEATSVEDSLDAPLIC